MHEFNITKIVFVLFLIILFSCNQKNEAPNESTENLRLITYNVWYGFTKVPERKNKWIRWMQEQKPDIVSLQELNEYTSDMLAADAASWSHPHSVLLKEEGFPTGITSKYPIEDVQRYMDGFHHGLLRVKIQGMIIYVIHLHPSNWEIRNKEIDFIITNIKGQPKDTPIILAGDFNTFSIYDSVFYSHGKLEPFFMARDMEYNEINLKHGYLDYSVLEKLRKNDLIDLEYHMRPSYYYFTGSFPTLIEKEGEHGNQRRLDYVFTNQKLADQVIRAEIIADEVTLKLSDHLPMIVDFEFVR
jgi:endonuclease/exonuclease/phosphatase family metal-dependent hydrolase